MSLLTIIEDAAGSMLNQQAGQAAPGTAQATAVAAIVQVLQQHPNGIGGIVNALQQCGLGGAVGSWISSGANQAVSGSDIQAALPNAVGQVAAKLGIDPNTAAGHMAELLPQILDHVSPNGQVPADGGMGALGGLLTRLGQGAQ